MIEVILPGKSKLSSKEFNSLTGYLLKIPRTVQYLGTYSLLSYLNVCWFYPRFSSELRDWVMWFGLSEILIKVQHQKFKSVFLLSGLSNTNHNKTLQTSQVHILVLHELEFWRGWGRVVDRQFSVVFFLTDLFPSVCGTTD